MNTYTFASKWPTLVKSLRLIISREPRSIAPWPLTVFKKTFPLAQVFQSRLAWKPSSSLGRLPSSGFELPTCSRWPARHYDPHCIGEGGNVPPLPERIGSRSEWGSKLSVQKNNSMRNRARGRGTNLQYRNKIVSNLIAIIYTSYQANENQPGG